MSGSEIELRKAKELIRRLLAIMPEPECEHFGHSKKQQHGLEEPCPLVKRMKEVTKEASDFVKNP